MMALLTLEGRCCWHREERENKRNAVVVDACSYGIVSEGYICVNAHCKSCCRLLDNNILLLRAVLAEALYCC
jgi:hypothetical protein